MNKQELKQLLFLALRSESDSRALISEPLKPLLSNPDLLRKGIHIGSWQIKHTDLSADLRITHVTVKYVIDDPGTVKTVFRRANNGELTFEPVQLMTGSGTIGEGVCALFNERQQIALVAVGDDTLEMQIGGFEQSIVVHPGTLMGLSRQVVERGDWRRVPKTKLRAEGGPLPAVVIRTPRTARTGSANTMAPPILYPHRSTKHDTGPDVRSGVLRIVNRQLAIYAIVAHRLLQAKGTNRANATMVVEKAAGRSLTPLEKNARGVLAAQTAFDDNNALTHWAGNPTHQFRIPLFPWGKKKPTLEDASVKAVELLQITLAKSERVLKAVQGTQLSGDGAAAEARRAAFSWGPNLRLSDCWRVAMFGDINPAPLWPVHSQHAQVFELGRFIGRVDRGGKAILIANHVEMLEWMLADLCIADMDIAKMRDDIRTAVEAHFDVGEIRKIMQQARESGGVIAVDRKTRRLRCRTDVGLKTRVLGQMHRT